MSTSKEKIKFAAKRLKGFFKIFLRNTKGIIGVLILLIFVFIVADAPFLTPYSPLKQSLSGHCTAPVWLKYLPVFLGGRPYLSENMLIVNDPGFQNLPAINSNMIGEWSFTKSPNITIQYEPTIGNPYKGGNPGCLRIALMRDEVGKLYGNHSIYIYKDYDFPYTGPPYQFVGLVAFFLNGTVTAKETFYVKYWNETKSRWEYNETSGQWEYRPRVEKWEYNVTVATAKYDVPVKINVIFEQLGTGKKWTIWPVPEYEPAFMERDGTAHTYTGKWEISKTSPSSDTSTIDSLGPVITLGLFKKGDPIYDTYTVTPGRYRYGLNITFQDKINKTRPVSSFVYVDDLDFKIMGTSWGNMGTDSQGRDLYSQLIYGAGISLYVGIVSAILAVVIGLIVGLVAGYFGGIVDEILMRFNDMLLVLPTLPLLIVLMSVLGAKLENLIIILGLLGWNGFARVVRSQVLSLKERSFIEAAKAAGAGRLYVITRHIVPNVMSLTYVTLATTVPGNIMAEAALSWLGFFDPYRISWGRMLYDVQFTANATQNWWWVMPPGLCIALLAVSFILLGYALDDVLNPKLRMRR